MNVVKAQTSCVHQTSLRRPIVVVQTGRGHNARQSAVVWSTLPWAKPLLKMIGASNRQRTVDHFALPTAAVAVCRVPPRLRPGYFNTCSHGTLRYVVANFERGFRRLGWVAILAVVLFTGAFAYEESSYVAEYEPLLLESDFPELDASYSSTRPVPIPDLGIVHVPSTMDDEGVRDVIARHFTKQRNPAAFVVPAERRSISNFAAAVRKKYPEYANIDDITVTKRILTKWPVYREQIKFSEYMLRPIRAKRPVWAAGVALAVAAVAIVVVQGGISVAAWVLRGFKDAA